MAALMMANSQSGTPAPCGRTCDMPGMDMRHGALPTRRASPTDSEPGRHRILVQMEPGNVIETGATVIAPKRSRQVTAH